MAATDVLEKYPIQLDAQTLRSLLDDVSRQIQVYDDLVKRFESQYKCDLKTFEEKIKLRELPEHPAWETSIEWGVALDELEKMKLLRKALEWILNFLS